MPMRKFDVNPLVLTDTFGMINLFERVIVIHGNLRCFFCLQQAKMYDDNNKPIIRHHKNCMYHCIDHTPFFMDHEEEISLSGNIIPTNECIDKYAQKIKLPNGVIVNCPRKPILHNNEYLRSHTINSVFEEKRVYTCKICHRTNESYEIIEHAYFCLLNGHRYTEDRRNLGTSPLMHYNTRLWSFSGKKIQWGYSPGLLAAFGFHRTNDQYMCMCGFSVNSQNWWGKLITSNDLMTRNTTPSCAVSDESRKHLSSIEACEEPLTNIILEHVLYKSDCVQLKSALGISTLNDILNEINNANIEY